MDQWMSLPTQEPTASVAPNARVPNLNPVEQGLIGPEGYIPADRNGDLQHSRRGSGSGKKHACAQCNKSFLTNNDLEKHAKERKHGAYECTCDQKPTFTKLSSLTRHIAEFNGTQKFRCFLEGQYLWSTRGTDCRTSCKRRAHLKHHLLAYPHNLEKKDVDALLRRFYPTESEAKGRRSRGNAKEAHSLLNATDRWGDPLGIQDWAREILEGDVRVRRHGSEASPSSVPRDVTSTEPEEAAADEEPVSTIVDDASVVTEGNDFEDDSDVFGPRSAGTGMTTPSFGANRSSVDPASETDSVGALDVAVTNNDFGVTCFSAASPVDLGHTMDLTIPGFDFNSSLLRPAPHVDSSGAPGAAARGQHDIVTASTHPTLINTSASIPANGYTQSGSHAYSMPAAYATPVHGASNMVSNHNATYLPDGLAPAPHTSQQCAYPVAYPHQPMMMVPVPGYWSSSLPMQSFTPFLSHNGGVSPAFGMTMYGMNGNAFNVAERPAYAADHAYGAGPAYTTNPALSFSVPAEDDMFSSLAMTSGDMSNFDIDLGNANDIGSYGGSNGNSFNDF